MILVHLKTGLIDLIPQSILVEITVLKDFKPLYKLL